MRDHFVGTFTFSFVSSSRNDFHGFLWPAPLELGTQFGSLGAKKLAVGLFLFPRDSYTFQDVLFSYLEYFSIKG